ncbi:outer membrane lipoprotein carrier protein LolA [Desulfococcaceae bacterium OttesenSCG-928-F15]|nr:outer membrane lipoprotein carrier protein LolA [Desulfococcaceae bacterium OttesenSCG-928-F15]
MKNFSFKSILCCLVLLMPFPAFANDALFSRIEKRYREKCFSVYFQQTSVLSAMDITERASGKVIFSHPGLMRWEYETPEPRLILTDGKKLWIYSPMEKEVLVGEAANYFGKGKGGRFLSDIASLREDFTRKEVPSIQTGFLRFRLLPKNPEPGLAEIFLEADSETGAIGSIETVNEFGDTTRILFIGEDHHVSCEKDLFSFTTPAGVQEFPLGQ